MLSKEIPIWEGRGDVSFTSYCLNHSSEIIGSDRRPAIIVCPGGGYQCLTEREGESVAVRFCANGYNAFVLKYSLMERAAFPFPLLDLAKAVLYIREHAAEFCVNPDKITLVGFSAGANLSASLGVLWKKPFLSDKLGTEAQKLKPNALVLGYPLTDFGIPTTAKLTPEESKMLQLSKQFATNSDARELSDYLNLSKSVTSYTPPTFLFHLDSDPVCPVQNSLEFAGALAKAGVPFELHVYEDKHHGVSQNKIEDTGDVFFKQRYSGWMNEMFVWLKRHMF